MSLKFSYFIGEAKGLLPIACMVKRFSFESLWNFYQKLDACKI